MELPLKSIQKLLQNTGMQAVMCISDKTHIILLLSELHWLTVGLQIQFKVLVLVLTFKALHSTGPLKYFMEWDQVICGTASSQFHLIILSEPAERACYMSCPESYIWWVIGRGLFCCGTSLWNFLLSKLRLTLSPLSFQNCFRT